MTSTPSRRRMCGVSLKMYFSPSTTRAYIDAVARLSLVADSLDVDLFVVPDFLSIASVAERLKGTSVLLGAQDCCEEEQGAYTGEVSAAHLAELGVKLVELGHAERRKLYGETDESVAKKAAIAARHGVTPLVCIGEVKRGSPEEALEQCRHQVISLLDAIPSTCPVVFAYEPVWAIGQPEPAASSHITETITLLRHLATSRGHESDMRFIYGGSAGPGLFEKLGGAVDGLFLGRFAHKLENLELCIREVAR